MTILDKDELNHTLLEYSHTNFARAQGSPFTVEPLQHLLQYDSLTPFGNMVFKGQAYLNALPIDEPAKALLTHMHDKMTSTTRTHPLIYEELQNGIKKWPEKTMTSPSG